MKVFWITKTEKKEWNFKDINSIPKDLLDMIIKFTEFKTDWYAYRMYLCKENKEDLKQDLLLIALEGLKNYKCKNSSLHTYLDKIYTNYFKNIQDLQRPALRERHGVGRISYDSENELITGEVFNGRHNGNKF